ncbi:MAG: methionyl-tRNA formyltransferase [Candidatus Coatesbacteria bacterium RBG_13_66_14]|uniref:Methionyl-tRNA formyltransferase n=1 Tax=Candidatus Coatesbacteria bacterium RBG_13_66_14 TaxID=1817816 RepID=A0A1F5EXT5_9BACT|nr:MAG: methionyl-tRNA formyltransferase [Candidatus Coatesbacteria bacterium RBG_13_66_14]
MMGPRLVFFGTPPIAARALEALVTGGFDVAAVVSQPDRPVGRGRNVQHTPVRESAEKLGLPVIQPESARDPGLVEYLKTLDPDLFTVVAYGNFLPGKLLSVPRLAALNLHFSHLPAYRGAAPVNWALVDGVDTTGVTVQRMVKKMDAGDVVLQRKLSVGPDETAPELQERLTALGIPLLAEAVNLIFSGNDDRTPQDESRVTFAPLLKREHGGLDFTRPARELHDRWRGLLPWPGVFCLLGEETLKVHRCRPVPENTAEPPGAVFRFTEDGWLTACGGGSVLEILEVQAGGSRRLPAKDFANGRRLKPAFRLIPVVPAPRA